MRDYEILYIVRPDLDEEQLKEAVGKVDGLIATLGGQHERTNVWGKRRLAYTVRSFGEGLYVLLTLEGTGGMIHEIERRLRVTEPVIKFITVRVDEEQKRVAKIKAIRATRVKRAPAAVAAPAPVAAEGAGSEPASSAV